jgi:hypothetical protein
MKQLLLFNAYLNVIIKLIISSFIPFELNSCVILLTM